MPPKDKKRLAFLLGKSLLELTSDEKKEFDALQAKALAENIVLDAAFVAANKDTAEENHVLTGDELGAEVRKAVAAEFAAKGFDAEAIAKSILEKSEKGMTKADMATILADSLKGLSPAKPADNEALITTIVERVKTQQSGLLTTEGLQKALEGFAASQRRAPMGLYPDGSANGGKGAYVEHRQHNLPLGQKQLLNICLGVDMNAGIPEALLKDAIREGEKRVDRLRMGIKSLLTTSGAGTGLEWIPTDLGADLQERLYLESALAQAMVGQEIVMPTDTFKLPLTTTRVEFKVATEAPGSDPASSAPGTGNILFDAKKLLGVAEYSYEAEEDAIIAVLPMLTDNMGKSAASSLEDAVVNGDTSATHQDADTHALTLPPAKLFPGLRKLAIAGSQVVSCATGGISAGNLNAVIKSMGKYGVRPSDLMFIFGPRGFADLRNLPETLTADKTGNPATARILSGQAASIWGSPIIISEHVRENLNALGVQDGVTSTKGTFLCIHRPSWMMGVRRQLLVEQDQNKRQQVKYVIASFRRAFVPKETVSATVPTSVLGYNYTA